ncbi:GGDEF domain-containing protein [Bacillus sp. ISL-18]|uniref:GGDEF domain-containing protein n=1 Tax=Bacillus sp. ISL-18 TaxID=2819118 RepID=UPI001BE6E1C2|nr:GGDEF domain-containing protein [Bacillus sp. ISL-18]MBT2658311.1 GGDEF domain-containing protein [Bacillus sp. ISL-18]
MSKDKIYIIILFLVSLLGSLLPKSHFFGETFFFKALLIYWFFTVLSFHLRTISKKGNVTIDYGLNYSLSFILIFGPAGLLVYESLFRIAAYFYKKVTKTDDPEEFLHIFYNIGSFVLQNTITFFDNFKRINDNFNHAVGDQVIIHFAKKLQTYLGKNDFLFRSGGEEFTMFIRNKDYEETTLLLDQILTHIENCTLNLEYKGETIQVQYTSSMGLYFFKLNERLSIEKGYIQADQLMLESKMTGRNRLTAQKAPI